MIKKSDIEIDREAVATTYRTLLNLKLRLAARKKTNAELPDLLARFDAGLVEGQLKQLKAGVAEALDEFSF